MDTVEHVDEHRISGSDCTDANALLDLCSSHMALGPFSHVNHLLVKGNGYNWRF